MTARPQGDRRLETVLRHSTDAVVLCDPQGRVLDANDTAEEVLRSLARDTHGTLLARLPEPLRLPVERAWQTVLRDRAVVTAKGEVEGTAVHVHLGVVVHHDRVDGVVVVWRPWPGSRGVPVALGPAEELRGGISGGQLRVHYQPIVELAAARPVASEALVRWEHPHRGLLAPGEFIDLAERTGLVVELGNWVLREACRTAAAWAGTVAEGAPLRVTVNLSAQQLRRPDLVGELQEALEETGCRPDLLVLEVTETAVMADLAAAVATLTALKELGVGLAIDDFGTGYSSLLYLKHFPVDTIKIDRSFVAGLGRDADDSAIVAATVSLAHSVDVACVAEGVETVEHLDRLRGMGCDFAQGFLFARPLPAEQADAWLRAHLPVTPAEPVSPALDPEVLELVGQGASLHTIAAALNARGSRTAKGTRWSARSVAHLIADAQVAR